MLCQVVILVSVLMQPATVHAKQAVADISEGLQADLPSGLPKDYVRQRLRPEGQSLIEHYAWREGSHMLTFGGVMAASYVLSQLLPSGLVGQGIIMLSAGVTLDAMTSQNWLDFTLRQVVRLPWLLLMPRFKAEDPLSFWGRLALLNIASEIPNLSMGNQEYLMQQQPEHSGLSTSIDLLDTPEESVQLTLRTEPVEEISFSRISSRRGARPFRHSLRNLQAFDRLQASIDKAPLSGFLSTLIDHQLDEILIKPTQGDDGRQVLEVKLHKDGGGRYLLLHLPKDELLPWSTSLFRSNHLTKGGVRLLSPLSGRVMREVAEFADSEDFFRQIHINESSDLRVFAQSGKVLQWLPAGEGSYFLIDHGLSQGLRAPDIWMGVWPEQVGRWIESPKDWLARLESRLIPGDECGNWRLLSSVRSMWYRMVSDVVVDLLTKPPETVSEYSSDGYSKSSDSENGFSQGDLYEKGYSEKGYSEKGFSEKEPQAGESTERVIKKKGWVIRKVTKQLPPPSGYRAKPDMPEDLTVIVSGKMGDDHRDSWKIASLLGARELPVDSQGWCRDEDVVIHDLKNNKRVVELHVPLLGDSKSTLYQQQEFLHKANKVIEIEDANTIPGFGLPQGLLRPGYFLLKHKAPLASICGENFNREFKPHELLKIHRSVPYVDYSYLPEGAHGHYGVEGWHNRFRKLNSGWEEKVRAFFWGG